MFRNTYFKQGSFGISGISLPSMVENTMFIKCSFHPNCNDISFVDCTFEDCDGVDYLDTQSCVIS
jgi:hypothetical protein